MDAAETAVGWRPFDASALEAAAAADRPVLLSLSAPWCRECRAMDREVYADPDVASTVEEGFVPVRVDADRRPRVHDRYAVGGLPSTAFLSPSGEVLTGATRLSAGAFRDVAERVRELWAEKGGDAGRIPRQVRSTPPAGEIAGIEGAMLERLRETFDPDYGGWGGEPKFPRPRAVEFALAREPELATRTLDPIRAHLVDTYDGGFFRYARNRDWSAPRREKLADENAALLRAFAAAYGTTGDGAYRETAEDAVTFLTTTLWTGEAFAGSQAAADPGYYRLDPSERESADDPPVDPTALAGHNGLVVDALLAYHAHTGDDRARRYAERTLDHLRRLVEGGTVVRYRGDDAPRGLLVDHARVVRAFATAAQVLDRSHAEVAVAAADGALDTLRTDDGFVDGPVEGPGLLDRPLYSIDANAELADALLDLHALTGDGRYRRAARDAVSAFAGARDRLDAAVAGYALAAAKLDGVRRIDVSAPAGSDLHRAALDAFGSGTVVVPDAGGTPGTATVAGGDGAFEAASPEALRERLDAGR